MSIDNVCQDGLVLPIAIPQEILAHPRRQLGVVRAAGTVDPRRAAVIPVTTKRPIILEVAV
jgi:hypothetical protein